MSKKIAKVVKLELPGGQAKPGSALASAGINMPKFCTEFNDKTKQNMGEVVPVIITAYEDKSFSFIINTHKSKISAVGMYDISGLDIFHFNPNSDFH